MDIERLVKELTFKATRSGGAGGQHVNKVSSKVILTFDLVSSTVLEEDEKEILLKNLKTRLTKDKLLLLNCSESRSQHKNKELVINRFLKIISEGLKVKKVRKKSKVSRAAIKKRLEKKSRHALKKSNRRKPRID
ncbi:MAG: alternative ribosome rescue aminoacyl-tRNA hydrolase ArfB [Urechidicola sp.]|jgi:ribosome-associated protein